MRLRRLAFVIAAAAGLGLAGSARAQLVKEFTAPVANSQPGSFTLGPDGNMWFGAFGASELVRVTPDGVMTEFPTGAGSAANLLTTGPDGNLWFTDAGSQKIGRMTTAGVVDEFPVLSANPGLVGIVAGSDGNLWFLEAHTNKLGRITTAGVVTE